MACPNPWQPTPSYCLSTISRKVEELLTTRGGEIAAVILEPINYNSGGIHPLPGYLDLLRRLTAEQGIVLIFDEVLSGFRTGPGCAQEYLGMTPDLCTIGKAIGGGTVLSVFGGKREIMSKVAPLGTAQHTGTYNGHIVPIMAATHSWTSSPRPGFYDPLLARSERLYAGIDESLKRFGIQGRVNGTGARFSILFGPIAEKQPLVNYSDTGQNDWDFAYRFYRNVLDEGVYMHTMWHHGLSSAHTEEDVDLLIERIDAALKRTRDETPAAGEGHGATFF